MSIYLKLVPMKFLVLALSALWLSPTWGYSGSKNTSPREIIPATLQVSASNVRQLHSTATTLSMIPIDSDQLLVASQPHTPVPATRVSLIKPKGFTAAKNFSGFEQTNTGASIIITEMPAPYTQIASGLNAANLKTRGMTLRKKQSITIDGYSGQLLQVTQVANLIEFVRWLVVFGDETETVIIGASLPKNLQSSLSLPLKSSILSAKWQKTKVLDPLADINFAVESTPKLKFALRVQNSLLYTGDGVIPAKSPESPIFIVAQAISNITVKDRKQFSENRLAQTAQIENLSIDTSSVISINGLSGYEIIGKARERDTNTPLTVYQVMLFEEDTYYIIQGIVGEKLKAEYLDDFQRMARSFKRKN